MALCRERLLSFSVKENEQVTTSGRVNEVHIEETLREVRRNLRNTNRAFTDLVGSFRS